MKNIDIFKIVPENYFSILSSLNKKLYIDIISLIYSLVQNGLSYGIDKDILVDEIEDYLNSIDVDVNYEEDEDIKSTRDKANFLIRRLIETGWIYPENTSDYKIIINFHDYSITLLEAFIKISDKQSLEYQGNIISIYTLLYSNEKSGIVLKQVYENTKGIISGLKSLNANIKKYMDRLTNKKTPEEIMKEFFGNYTKEVIDKSYHRLKTSENISKYRPKIISKLKEDLLSDEFIREAAAFYKEDEEFEDIDRAKDHVNQIINNIIEAFDELDDIMEEIDTKNTKYIRAAVTRAKFLLNNSKDMTGIIKNILSYVCSQYQSLELNMSKDYLEEITDLFTLYSYNYIDESSLYISNEGKKTFKPSKIDTVKISEEERRKKLDEFKKKQKKQYSIKKVNNIVMELLKDKDKICSDELTIENINDFIKVIYIRLYGNNPLAKYSIKKTSNKYNKNGFEFNNFEIWRKK